MITTMTGDHLASCVSLYLQTFNAPPWNESWRAEDAAQRLGDFLSTPRAFGLCLAHAEDGLLGFALGHLERSGAEDYFLLKEMCVRTSEQRKGYGTRLLEALAE